MVESAAIVAEWALGKVQRVTLTKSGDTYTGATTAFLTGVKNPVALIMSSDHSLFVGDWSTGKVYRIAKALLSLATPITVFTAEEIWRHFPHVAGDLESAHLALFPKTEDLGSPLDAAKAANWEKLLVVRTEVLRALEAARNAKTISGALEAKVVLSAPPDLALLLEQYESWLPALFIVSQVELAAAASADAQKSESLAGLSVAVQRADGAKCERCWNYSTHVGENNRYPTVCERCTEALAEIESGGSASVAVT